MIDAGVTIRAAELSKQQTNVATYSSWLVGLDADALAVVSTADLDITVAVCHAAAVSKAFRCRGFTGKLKHRICDLQ